VLRPAWVQVDIEALEHNLALLRARVHPAGVLAVVKADAYGHGARIVGRSLEAAGVDWLGVALVEEGIELRRGGVRTPILILGVNRPGQRALFETYQLTPTISSLDHLSHWLQWTEAGGPGISVHLKMDVGMHRLGLAPDELPRALQAIRENSRLELGGLLSHLAEADDLESARTLEQERRFATLVDHLSDSERETVHLHLANSAAALHHPATRHTFVRSGLALFGLDPAGRESGLRAVMSVTSRIVQERVVPAGARPGYGATWTAPRESRLGVVPIGYADGYSWRLSNRAEMLIEGRRVPVVGAVSMDMTLVDLTDVTAGLGDRIVLLGSDGQEEITAFELARRADTIPYEILCHLGLRMPRRYRRGAVEVATDSQLEVSESRASPTE
jgi:alanine racemase